MIKNFNEYINEQTNESSNVDFNYDELCVLLCNLRNHPLDTQMRQ